MIDLDSILRPAPGNPPVALSESAEPVWELARLFPAQGEWTAEEYLRLTDHSNLLIEFTDGRLEFVAMPTRMHSRLVKFMLFALASFIEPRGWGEVLPTGMRVRVREGKYRIPDLVCLAGEHEKQWGGERVFRGADLAVEVVSEGTESRHRDYSLKVADYAEGQIGEYWIVDPFEKQVTVLTLPKGKADYEEHGVFVPGQIATSHLLDGFAVDVAELWAAGASFPNESPENEASQ